jgi:hypothetical protein
LVNGVTESYPNGRGFGRVTQTAARQSVGAFLKMHGQYMFKSHQLNTYRTIMCVR